MSQHYVLTVVSGQEEVLSSTIFSRVESVREIYYPTQLIWKILPKHKRKKNGACRAQVVRSVLPGFMFIAFKAEPRFSEILAFRNVFKFLGTSAGPMPMSDADRDRVMRLSSKEPEKLDDYLHQLLMIGCTINITNRHHFMHGRDYVVSAVRDKDVELTHGDGTTPIRVPFTKLLDLGYTIGQG